MELAVRPDHQRGVVFRTVFGSTQHSAAAKAIRTAVDVCLPNPDVRKTWIAAIRRAMLYMLGYEGDLEKLANGRMAEFTFLIIALERYEVRYDHA